MIQYATLSLYQSLLSALRVSMQLVAHRRERKCEDMKRTPVTLFTTVVLLLWRSTARTVRTLHRLQLRPTAVGPAYVCCSWCEARLFVD